MADDNKIQFDLELATKSFESAIAAATKSVESFGKSFDRSTDEASKELDKVGDSGKQAGEDVKKGAEAGGSAWETFKGVLGADAVVGAFNFIKDAALGLFNTLVVDGVKGAIEAEASLNKLKSALIISGDAANGTLEDFQAYAAGLQETTTADGDAVLAQLALAKQYGLTNAQAKDVVKVATDMAARGYDADASVRQLSEALNGQVGRLGKLNPALKELTEEQLKAGAATEILGGMFAGAAVAQVTTFEGSIKQAENAFGDLQEEIGFLITKNPALIAAIQTAVDLFQQFTGYIADNGDAIRDLLANGVNALINALKLTIDTGMAFAQFVQDNSAALEAMAFGIGVAAAAYAAYVVVMNAGAIATGVATAATWLFNAALTANPIGIVIAAVAALAGGLYYLATNWDEVTSAVADFAAGTLRLLIPTMTAIVESIRPVVAFFDEELAAGLDNAAVVLEEKAQELTDLAIEAQRRVDTAKQESRDREKTEDDAANAAKLAGARATTTNLVSEEQSRNAQLASERTAALVAAAEADKKAKEDAKALQKKIDEDARKAEADQQKAIADQRRKWKDEQTKADADWLKEKERREQVSYEQRAQAEKSFGQSLVNDISSRRKWEEASDRERVANFRSTMGEIATLQNSSSKELFAIGKAAALTQATINTYQAASVALASAPPPFNFALAAAVTVAGLLNVSKIAASQPPSAGKFAEGGIVPGASFTGDRLTAQVNSREAIFTVSQQKRLFDLASGRSEGGPGSALSSKLDALADAIFGQPIVLQLDGEVIATAVRDQVRGGFALGST